MFRCGYIMQEKMKQHESLSAESFILTADKNIHLALQNMVLLWIPVEIIIIVIIIPTIHITQDNNSSKEDGI
eukprot:12434669-Ditylum_brightwellii.AAC.1